MPAGENRYTGMGEDGSAGFVSRRVCGGAVGRHASLASKDVWCDAVTVMDFRLRGRARRRFAFCGGTAGLDGGHRNT